MNLSPALLRSPGRIAFPLLIGLSLTFAASHPWAATSTPSPVLDPNTSAPVATPPPEATRNLSESGVSTRSPAEALVAAKLLEEGDGDPQQALRAYLEIIRVRDQQRPSEAEALFRAGEVARRLGLPGDATGFYQRVVREYSDLSELAQRSQQRLDEATEQGGDPNDTPTAPHPIPPDLRARYALAPTAENSASAAEPAPEASEGPDHTPPQPGYKMSPELMRRYGLLPNPDADQPPKTTFKMSPALMRRYGLIPNTENPPAAEASETAGQPPTSVRQSTSRNTMSPALQRRYGIGRYGTGAPSAEHPDSGAAPGASDPGGSNSKIAGPDELEIRGLRAEVVELRSRLRRNQRQQRALESVALADDANAVRLLPVTLIEDPRLLRMLEELDRLDERRTGGATKATEHEAVETARQASQQTLAIREYIQDTLKRRLIEAEQLLSKEHDQLAKILEELETAHPTTERSPGVR